MEKKFHTIKQKQNGLMPQNLKATYCEKLQYWQLSRILDDICTPLGDVS